MLFTREVTFRTIHVYYYYTRHLKPHVPNIDLVSCPVLKVWERDYIAALLKPFPPNDAIWRHETFSFMMSHPAMSLRDRLCVSRKGGAREGGWVHRSMAASGLSFEQPLVEAGQAISRVLSINGPRKQWSHLAEPRIPVLLERVTIARAS